MATPRGLPSHLTATTITETIKDKQLMETTRNFQIISTIDLTCCNIIYLFIYIYVTAGQYKIATNKGIICNIWTFRLIDWNTMRSVLEHLFAEIYGGTRKHSSPSLLDNCWYQMRCDHEVSKEWIMKREKHLEHKHSMGTFIALLTLFLHSQRSHLIKESRTQECNSTISIDKSLWYTHGEYVGNFIWETCNNRLILIKRLVDREVPSILLLLISFTSDITWSVGIENWSLGTAIVRPW